MADQEEADSDDCAQCACFFDSLTLPLYSPTDPNPMTDNTRILIPCVCGMPFKRCVSENPSFPSLERAADLRFGSSRLVEEHGSSLVRRHASQTGQERDEVGLSEDSDSDEDDETRARNRRRRADEGRPKVGELR
jgi:hypothetical protein